MVACFEFARDVRSHAGRALWSRLAWACKRITWIFSLNGDIRDHKSRTRAAAQVQAPRFTDHSAWRRKAVLKSLLIQELLAHIFIGLEA